MLNKFKLWFNKNEFKIIMTVIVIVVLYSWIKYSNNYYKKQHESENINSSNSTNTVEEIFVYDIDEIEEIDEDAETYEDVYKVMKKIINWVYDANNTTNNLSLRTNIYNMFTDELIEEFSNDEEKVSVDNILNYIFYNYDASDYYVGTINKCWENNNVARYAVELKYKDNGEENIYGYAMINMDYNNNTFSYDGTWASLLFIDEKEITEIENKGSNIF